MSEISINIPEINNEITKLQSLQSKWSSERTTPPSTIGGGKSVNAIEDLAEKYKSLGDSLDELISNTIYFLENTKNSFISSDSSAADGIRNL